MGTLKHIGIFQRFILPFGNADDYHPVILPEVKQGRAYQVSDIFNEENGGLAPD